jgi:uncharacterized tellurite resistance protein B-like protein
MIFMPEYMFDVEESLAVARMAWMLIFSDGAVENGESEFFTELLGNLHLSEEAFEQHLSVPEEADIERIRRMPSQKRRECATLLRLAVDADGKVERLELSKLNFILDRAEIFKPDRKDLKQNEGGFS